MNSDSNETKSSRRTLLKGVIFTAGGIISAGLGIPAIKYAAAPAFAKSQENWASLGPISKFKVNSPEHVNFEIQRKDGWYTVKASNSTWVVKKSESEFDVFDPKCTHLGCPYSWDAKTNNFLCPCHGGVFSIEGKVLAGPPPRPLDRFVHRVENGNLVVSEEHAVA